MKATYKLLAGCILFTCATSSLTATTPGKGFTENKGQVHDQDNKARPDVLFSGGGKSFNYHLRNNGISYQVSAVSEWKKLSELPVLRGVKIPLDVKMAAKILVSRVDITWVNANRGFVLELDDQLPGIENFYGAGCPNGILNVRSFNGVTYRNIYNGINAHYYTKDGELKYDLIVAAGADYHQAGLKVEGAEKIVIDRTGNVIISTELGEIIEGAPVVYQKGRQLKANWILLENVLSFNVQGYDPAAEMLIDPPVRAWGTLYGGSGDDFFSHSTTDLSGNILACGLTGSQGNIATSGSHQVSLNTDPDGFLLRMDASGNRVWATYYGAEGLDYFGSCSFDNTGNVFACGLTEGSSSTALATPGSHKSTTSAILSAFLVKFNGNGVRQWGTYYGGTTLDAAYSCQADATGNVYMSGLAFSTSGISTPGSHQPVFGGSTDAFLAKFDGTGILLWGTYYGGSVDDDSYSCTLDAAGDVILGGSTSSTNNISTNGVHQTALAGGTDGFVAKFNSSGVRQWGTYFGGAGDEAVNRLTTDGSNRIYVPGSTDSQAGISLNGHQIALAGSTDGYISVFSATGGQLYGSYYGGTGDDGAFACDIDGAGNFYVSGTAGSAGNISTPGSYQPVYGGGTSDAYLVKFNALCSCPSNGTRDWATYYGAGGDEQASSCTEDQASIIIAGLADVQSAAVMCSQGCHQGTFGGGVNDGYLVKFQVCQPSTNTTPVASRTICVGNSATLSASGTNVSWFSNATSTVVIGTGPTIVQTTSASGAFSVYAQDASCTIARTLITYTVFLGPALEVIQYPSITCPGSAITLSASGGGNLLWTGGSTDYTLGIKAFPGDSYTVTSTNFLGCVSTVIYTPAVDPCVSLKENSANELVIFPNPAKNSIRILYVSGAKLKVFNAIGTVVMNVSTTSDKTELDLSVLTDGVYFIESDLNGLKQTRKIIKQ